MFITMEVTIFSVGSLCICETSADKSGYKADGFALIADILVV